MTEEHDAYLTVPALKTRGWTDALVRTFLGEPDRTTTNPHYRSGPPMRLYLRARVESSEVLPAFTVAQTKAQARQARGRVVSQQKREAMAAWVERLQIAVPRLEPAVLVERACAHYNRGAHVPEWVWERQQRDGYEHPAATPDSPPPFLARITVNYLRHQLTRYERLLGQTFGKVGAAAGRGAIAKKVFTAIGETYPHLAGECTRQYAQREAQGAYQ